MDQFTDHLDLSALARMDLTHIQPSNTAVLDCPDL